MDLLKDNLKKLYLRFLILSLGSAMVMSIYTLTDAIVIGKGVGSDALAALSITTPLFYTVVCCAGNHCRHIVDGLWLWHFCVAWCHARWCSKYCAGYCVCFSVSDGNRRGCTCVRDRYGDSGAGWDNPFFQPQKPIEIHPAQACVFKCGADYRKWNSKLFQ